MISCFFLSLVATEHSVLTKYLSLFIVIFIPVDTHLCQRLLFEKQGKIFMKLVEYLKNEGVTQKHFAKKVGIGQNALNSILLNKSTPSLKTAWSIEKATNGQVTLYDWVKNLDDDKSEDI